MATRNPFAHNDDKGEAWELGYLAGFAEPETDHFLPFSPELSEVYQRGEQAGRDDRRRLPPDTPASGEEEEGGASHSWVDELAEHVFIHALGVGLEKLGLQVGGLIGLVLTVIMIPGDVALHPLEPEWEAPKDQESDIYVAVCMRTDHPMVVQGTTADGYWTGTAQTSFDEAAGDRRAHAHAEAIVVRCSTADGGCGPVWPVQ